MTSAPLDHAALWQRIRSLLDSVALVADRDGFLDECLDRIVELLGADRGMVLLSLVLEQTGRVRVAQRELAAPRSHDPSRVAPPSLEEMLRPPSMQEVREEIETALSGRLPVVILGDTGSGKTQLALAVAEAS